MKHKTIECNTKQPILFSRVAYVLFLLLVVYQLIRGDIENATINLGIALIFDPFDAEVKWQDRPFYQRAWLIVHLALTLTGFIHLILR